MGVSFLDGPTLSTSFCIGSGCLADLMIFEENAAFARHPSWSGDTWKADYSGEYGFPG
jgi:hypothetical protein